MQTNSTGNHKVYEGESCFLELADALREPVCVVRPDGRLLYGNRTWHSFTTIAAGNDFPSAYLGMVHPEDRQRWIDAWQRAIRSQHSYEIEHRVRAAADKDYVSQLEQGYPVRAPNGDVVEWILIATTCDESRRVIDTLRRSLVRKDEFLAVVAHELKNPLAPIANALALLERHGSDPVLMVNARALISRQVRQLVRLVDDLLDLARLERQELEVRKDLIDLRLVLTAAVEVAQPMISTHGHHLTTTVPASPAMIHGDEGRLIQVLANLLINAAKFTNDGGRIWLSLEKQLPWIRVGVRDTGIGISGEMLPRVFEAYVQVERGAPRARGGLGLGLALAQQLVRSHGGALTAHSDGIGKGSEFVLKLPAQGVADPGA